MNLQYVPFEWNDLTWQNTFFFFYIKGFSGKEKNKL